MKNYLPTILATILTSCFTSTAQAQTCLNYWINPKTGAEECLNNFRQPYIVNSGYTGNNFTTGKFTLSPDPEDPDGVVQIKGLLKNISSQALEVSTINVDLMSGNTIIKSVKIEFSRSLSAGKSALITGSILKEDLNGISLKQINVVPTAVNYE